MEHKLSADIVSKSPPFKNLQMMRFKKAVDFHCSRCNQDKKAKNIAIVDNDWSKKLCNGCYGNVVAGGKI